MISIQDNIRLVEENQVLHVLKSIDGSFKWLSHLSNVKRIYQIYFLSYCEPHRKKYFLHYKPEANISETSAFLHNFY